MGACEDVARELGETSLMFLVHPTLTEEDMVDTRRRKSFRGCNRGTVILQDHPEYEILFCVSEADDPVVPVIARD